MRKIVLEFNASKVSLKQIFVSFTVASEASWKILPEVNSHEIKVLP